jgi:hypothetical protein
VEDGPTITEGHHRLVAAILLCMDRVPTTPNGRAIYRRGINDWREDMVNAHHSADPHSIYIE